MSRGESLARRPWVERLLARAGVPAYAGRSPLFWYTVGVFAVELVVVQALRLAEGFPLAYAENPLLVIRLVLFPGAALATTVLHERYDRAVARSHLLERTAHPDQFAGLVPDWLSKVLVGVGVCFTLVNALGIITVGDLLSTGGTGSVLRFVVLTPLGYVPVVATVLATYLSVEVLLPRRLERSDVRLDYLDPEGLGGMRPLGELLKAAYYYLMAGLVAYAVALYGPFVFEGVLAYEKLDQPGAGIDAAFTFVWAAAVGAMAYGIYVLHRYMSTEKRETLHRLDREARDHLSEPWTIDAFDPTDQPETYEQYLSRVDHVTSTREYPATFTMWTQILVGVAVPKGVQLLLTAL